MSVAFAPSSSTANQAASLVEVLERDGVVRLPPLVSAETLRAMQEAFASRLRHLKWNNVDGYERTERHRLMVQDALTLAQGFVDIALHPLVVSLLDEYLGARYQLREAKGWQSQPTHQDFNGWHGDMWYDQTKVTDHVPREVKLAFYLSDVKSGGFQYVRGTHGKQAPRALKRTDVALLPLENMVEFLGGAGTAVLFDTSGSHRQAVPILEPRWAVFYNYHDPDVPLQAEDVKYYRYHPLLLNAAFLGDLTPKQQRILGFGDQTHFQRNFVREPSQPWMHTALTKLHAVNLLSNDWSSRLFGKLGRLLRRS
jgi:hypothetical protein